MSQMRKTIATKYKKGTNTIKVNFQRKLTHI